MKKLFSVTNIRTVVRGFGAINGTILLVLCAVQFALQTAAPRAQSDPAPSCTPVPSGTCAPPLPIPSPTCTTTASPTPLSSPCRTPDQTFCTPTPTPYALSQNGSFIEVIPCQFQNPNGAQLAWLPFPTPAATPTPRNGPCATATPQGVVRKPAVMVIHPGNWNAYSGDSGLTPGVAADIANTGEFFVVSVWFELAPPGYIPGQPCHYLDDSAPGSRMKQTVDDIKALVCALRADPRCNGKVAVLGGSAGANLAVTVALDTTESLDENCKDVWPWWFKSGIDSRPDCAVMLSAIYDFSDWTPPNNSNVTDSLFVKDGLLNYAQTLDLNTLASLPLNPVGLVSQTGASGWGFKPLFLINSWCDNPTAYHQIVTMTCALEGQADTDYQILTVPNAKHAFGYWNGVRLNVLAFLEDKLGVQ